MMIACDHGHDRETSAAPGIRTQAFIHDLHTIWTQQAPLSAYDEVRDALLAERDQLDTHVITLCSVAKIACPDTLDGNPQWQKLLDLASHIEGCGKKRKRAYNEANRLRNFALVAALWSLPLVLHYGWDQVGQVQMRAINACATQYPRFREDLAPRLNNLLLQRHCEAIANGRRRTLDEAPLQPLRDLNVQLLAAVIPDQHEIEQWVTSSDGRVTVDEHGTLLNQIRPNHYHMYLLRIDQYGLIASRGAQQEVSTSPAYLAETTVAQTSACSDGSPVADPALDRASDASWQDITPEQPSTAASSVAGPASLVDSSRTASSIATPPDLNLQDVGHFRDRLAGCDGIDPLEHFANLDHNTCEFNSPRNAYAQVLHDFLCSQTHTQSEPPVSRSEGSVSPKANHTLNMRCPPEEAILSYAQTDSSEVLREDTLDRLIASVQFGNEAGAGASSTITPQVLDNQHRNIMMPCITHTIGEESGDETRKQQTRHLAWLTPDAQWANVFAWPGNGMHCGQARSEHDAEVVQYTAEDFIANARQGHIFRKPILIKERFSDSNMHTAEALALQLHDRSTTSTINVRRLDGSRPTSVGLDTIAHGLRTGKAWGSVTALSFRNITRCQRPLLTMLSRFRLLDCLIERKQGSMSNAEREDSLSSSSEDHVSFNICGPDGTSSDAYLNTTSGAWIRLLHGTAIWMIVPENEMEGQWLSFMDRGHDWVRVPDSKQKLILLEQDDVLLLPPGLKIVQAMHSPTTTVIEGGLLWDELNVIQILHCISWELENSPGIQSPMSRELPCIIDQLVALVSEQPERFCGRSSQAEFLDQFAQQVSNIDSMRCSCGALSYKRSQTCYSCGRAGPPGKASWMNQSASCDLECTVRQHGTGFSDDDLITQLMHI